MIYRVTARFKPATPGKLRRKLDDGTIVAQQPDGEVMWSERYYCQPPLAHERTPLLDHYFNDLTTEAIEGYERYDGRPFMDYLRRDGRDAPSPGRSQLTRLRV